MLAQDSASVSRAEALGRWGSSWIGFQQSHRCINIWLAKGTLTRLQRGRSVHRRNCRTGPSRDPRPARRVCEEKVGSILTPTHAAPVEVWPSLASLWALDWRSL
ncbi:uncharacterized protein PS065_021552 [Dugong dugon]